jgi:hypothetical protein
MPSVASIGSRGSSFRRSVRQRSIGSKGKAKKEKNVRKNSQKKKKSTSLEGCIEERNWDGALVGLLREEQVRDDLPFAWSLDSCQWRDDYTNSNSGGANSQKSDGKDAAAACDVLNKACQTGAPMELINRIMMMYPLMIKSLTLSGKTTLHAACECGASTAVVASLCDEMLRVAPSLLLAEDNLGTTALQCCLFKKNADPDTISVLREALCELGGDVKRTEYDDFPIRRIVVSWDGSSDSDRRMPTSHAVVA